MENSKHTPGPWKIVNWDSSSQIRDKDNNEIALLRNDNGNDVALPDEKTISNAKLIAAAPNLLEALQAVLGYEQRCANKGNPMIGNGILSIINEAIKKATK